MPKVTKLYLMAESVQASNKALEMVIQAKQHQLEAVQLHDELEKARNAWPTDAERIRKLKIDRDWCLQLVDDYYRYAQRYCRDSRRLTRRARWKRE